MNIILADLLYWSDDHFCQRAPTFCFGFHRYSWNSFSLMTVAISKRFSLQYIYPFHHLFKFQLLFLAIIATLRKIIQGLYNSFIPLSCFNMPLHCFFISLVLSIDGIGSYKTAQLLVLDGENVKHEISVKYYQSNENNLTVDTIYQISSTCILRSGKLPQVTYSCFILVNFHVLK